jgi:hypothetical protein
LLTIKVSRARPKIEAIVQVKMLSFQVTEIVYTSGVPLVHDSWMVVSIYRVKIIFQIEEKDFPKCIGVSGKKGKYNYSYGMVLPKCLAPARFRPDSRPWFSIS